VPTLGADVAIGANAVVIGRIMLGNGAVVGAGAVVLCDVPAGAMIVGNPGVINPAQDRFS